LTALVGSQHTGSITALILEQVGSLDETLAAFLAHDELLGNAVLFFFREKIRDDKRVEASLAALQREGLWADVSDIKLAQQQLSTSLQQKLDELFIMAGTVLSSIENKTIRKKWILSTIKLSIFFKVLKNCHDFC
jgi:hypothetical protein